jgi:hypothetical protein
MLWGLVSGDVEEYVENCQDWYQALGVCMWFANGGISFKEAFEMLQTKHAKQNCIEYALMELYAKQKSVDQVLVGEDTRLLWTCGLYLNAEMDLLTSQMMMELEQSGQWQHALFVASFLENQREEQLIRILERWYPLDDASGSFINTETSQVFQFVKGLGIPEKWIHQSRVVSARYQNNTKQELISLMDCGDFVEAHKLLYRIVPRLLLLNRYETQVMQQVVELMQRNGWNCEWIQEIKKGQYEGHDLMTKRAVEMFKTRDVSGQSFKLLQQLV